KVPPHPMDGIVLTHVDHRPLDGGEAVAEHADHHVVHQARLGPGGALPVELCVQAHHLRRDGGEALPDAVAIPREVGQGKPPGRTVAAPLQRERARRESCDQIRRAPGPDWRTTRPASPEYSTAAPRHLVAEAQSELNT